MLFWAVVSDLTEEPVELFSRREEAEAVVQAWDVDKPEQLGALRVETVEFETSPLASPLGKLPSEKEARQRRASFL